jgi:tetratricopeptide (TPR) repeat protein
VDTRRLFLSYAQPDSQLVSRACEDLKRARVGDVWCYEVSSEYGVDFREEFLQRIDSANVFVLFDSRHARRSPHVREEIARCRSLAGIGMLVCLVEPPGPWRETEVFDGQNRIVYMDFNNYESGIRNLCAHFGSNYVPRFTMPRDIDFENEINAIAARFTLEERQAIFDKYAFFRSMFAREPAVAEAQLVVLVREHLQAVDAQIISPLLALGALRNEAKGFSDAHDAFTAVTLRAPADPRGWAGQASALFGLADYQSAADAWDVCLARIRESGDQRHHRFAAEILHNLASALFEAGKPAAAWERLAGAASGDHPNTEDLILAGKILLCLDERRADAVLRRAAKRVSSNEAIQSDLLVDLIESLRAVSALELIEPILTRAIELYPQDADIIRQLAVYNTGLGHYKAAIGLYQKALRLAPGNPRCLVELAMLKRFLGDHSDWRPLVRECFRTLSQGAVDEYYLGLAHFLDGREETARFFYRQSQRSLICAKWPFYKEIIG